MSNKVGSGFLYPNKNRKADNQPNATGKITVDGKEYRIAAWTKEKDGVKYQSIAVSEFTQAGAADNNGFDNDDDQPPF